MRTVMHGISVANGLALGRAHLRKPRFLSIEDRRLSADEIEPEVERLHQAIASTRAELIQLRNRLPSSLIRDIGDFLDIHTMLLNDPDLITGVVDLIRVGHHAASHALMLQRDHLTSLFNAMDDPYLRSRSDDIEQIIGRIQLALHHDLDGGDIIGVAGNVLITDSVAPAELAQLCEQGVVAILASRGSALSHSAIMARSLGLPMLIVSDEQSSRIPSEATLLVDAHLGEIIIDPDANDLDRLHQHTLTLAHEKHLAPLMRDTQVRTRDKHPIQLQANAESPEEIAHAYSAGATSIGLYRTEWLFLQANTLPDEDTQFTAYRDAVLGMQGRPVTLRTLDLGADKADRLGISPSHEPNPALGLRGMRLTLARPGLFRTQLRAMLRASAFGPIRLLAPMITRREELRQWRQQVREYTRELRAEGHRVAKKIPLGAMIEVPIAALTLPDMIDAMDFLSIGTNDLCQYLLATDRENDAVAPLFSPLYPAIIRLLHQIIQTGKQAGKPVSICGEMASDTRYTRLLLALGLEEFSMHPTHLDAVREQIASSHHQKLRKRCPALLEARSRRRLEQLVAAL